MSYSNVDSTTLMPFRASSLTYSSSNLCSDSTNPGKELGLSSRYFRGRSASASADNDFPSFLRAAVYSVALIESLLGDGVTETSMNGTKVSAMASKVVHWDLVSTSPFGGDGNGASKGAMISILLVLIKDESSCV